MKIAILSVLLFLIPGSFSVGFAQDAGAAELYHREASRAFEENRLDDAEGLLKKAVEIDPKNYQYHFELSHLYAARFDKTQKPSDPIARASYERAIQELKETQVLKKDFIPAFYNLGILYKNLERYEEARMEFRRVLDLDPKEVKAYLGIGETYERQGFYEDARDFYRKAKTINPGDLSIQDAMDLSYQNEKQYENARRSKDRSDQMMRWAQPVLQSQQLSSPTDSPANPSTNSSSLTQAAMALAQGFLNRGKEQE